MHASDGDRIRIERAEELAAGAADWLLATARPRGTGLEWTARAGATEPDTSLYRGAAGIVLALREAHQHFADERYGDAAARGADALAADIDPHGDASLYFGLAGTAVTLRSLGRDAVTRRALDAVRAQFDGERWNDMYELFVGNAGIGLGALHAGDLDLAVRAVTPYLRTADPTPAGVNWAVRPSPPRSHHIAHGTLGIVYALLAIGTAAGREDLVALAAAGAADVVSRDEAGPDGFVVPHSDPPHRPDIIERYSYGWCNGPAGDAQVFRLFHAVTGDPAWTALVDRCWSTVVRSGLPARIRPGFWDNNGRCCGTAGVLALGCDLMAERGGDHAFTDGLVDDLITHATVDADGARWSNYEPRAEHSDLPAETGWAMGNAGILRELLRYVRLRRRGEPGYAVDWPDHPPVASRLGETWQRSQS